MKKLLLLSMLLFSISSFAQEELTFSQVIQSETGVEKAVKEGATSDTKEEEW